MGTDGPVEKTKADPPKVDDATTLKLQGAVMSSVQVFADNGQSGSGFIADEKGHVVTDWHVVANASEIFVTTADGKQYRAGLEKIADTEDMATLKLLGPDTSPHAPRKFADTSKLQPGDPVFVIGHPLGQPQVAITPGRFTRLTTPMDFYSGINPEFRGYIKTTIDGVNPLRVPDIVAGMSRPDVQLQMDTAKGNSGGAVVNADGEVISVHQASLNGFSIGSPSERIQAMLDGPGKFEIRHGFRASHIAEAYKSELANDPFRTITLTAATTVPLGALAYVGARKAPWGMGPLVALHGGTNLFADGSKFFDATNSRDSLKFGVASGSDLIETAGGIAMLFPRTRTIGIVAASVGLAGRVGSDFIPNRYVVESITRRDGTALAPMDWHNISK